jgi:hypothetical protein
MLVEKINRIKYRAVGTYPNVAYLRHAKWFKMIFATNILLLWSIVKVRFPLI